MKAEESNFGIVFGGQVKEIEHISHIRLLVNWRTSASNCA
jgi:hypothetical protein